MKLKQSLEEKLMDVRLRDRLVGEGKINKKDVDTYLNSLPEETKNSYVNLGGYKKSVSETEQQ